MEKLRQLERRANNGQGNTTVRNIILYVERGDIARAEALAHWDGDKIRNDDDLNREVRRLLPKYNASQVRLYALFGWADRTAPQ